MAYEVSYVDNADTVLAHCKMVDRIKTLALANGWTALRDVTATDSREVILKGVGLTGLEEIYVGIKTYYDSGADIYNLTIGGFTGYLAGSTFETQPGYMLSSVPAHNNRIDYWLIVNAQRIACGMKVGTPVYESFYMGKFFPYARPTQYPYPLYVGGSLAPNALTRFSDIGHSMPYKGASSVTQKLRGLADWVANYTHPYNNATLCGGYGQIRDNTGIYHLLPVELYDATNVYGVLDGIYHISGFNNAVENTLVISGNTYVVIQDVWRTGHSDYYAMRLQ